VRGAGGEGGVCEQRRGCLQVYTRAMNRVVRVVDVVYESSSTLWVQGVCMCRGLVPGLNTAHQCNQVLCSCNPPWSGFREQLVCFSELPVRHRTHQECRAT